MGPSRSQRNVEARRNSPSRRAFAAAAGGAHTPIGLEVFGDAVAHPTTTRKLGRTLRRTEVGVWEETATESAKVDSGKADRVAEMVEELMPDERRLEREYPLRW